MFNNVLESIAGIGIFPIISLFIFFAVFVAAVVMIFSTDKEHLNRMASLPLESTNQQLNAGQED